MECREAERFADLSFDGEIEPTEQAELDAHLGACSGCRGKVSRRSRFHMHLRTKLQTSEGEAPREVRQRVVARLRQEARGERVAFTRAVPVTLAVATVAVLSWSSGEGVTLDPEEPVARHSRNLPPEIHARGDASEVRRFLKENLRYSVQVPRLRAASNHGVRLVGARLSNIANRDAAYLMYDKRGARISLFAYPRPQGFVRPASFRERYVHGRPILMGTHRGYNVIAWEQADMLYSLVSEVDHDQLVELAVSLEE